MLPELKNGDYNELINSVAEFFEEVIAYIQKVLAALESKFGFEIWYEEQNAESSEISE